MHSLIESHRAEIRALADRHGFGDVRVFGSMARGDADDGSDVDLLVTLPRGQSGSTLGAIVDGRSGSPGAQGGHRHGPQLAPRSSASDSGRRPDPVKADRRTTLVLLGHIRDRLSRIDEYTGGEEAAAAWCASSAAAWRDGAGTLLPPSRRVRAEEAREGGGGLQRPRAKLARDSGDRAAPGAGTNSRFVVLLRSGGSCASGGARGGVRGL